MEKDSKFNLAKILEETTKNLKEKFPEAQDYLLELSTDALQTRLTPTKALEIAEKLLEKVDSRLVVNEN